MPENPFAKYAQRGTIVSPSPRADPLDVRRDAREEKKFEMEEKKFSTEQAKESEEAAKQARAYDAASGKLVTLVGKLGRTALDANDNSGWFETGTSGKFARNWLPESLAGSNLAKDIDTLRANFAFDALQAMRDASKTGGALGAISERELQLLESATANIDPNQGHDNFLRNIEDARQAYLSKLNDVDPETAKEMGFNPTKAESAWKRINSQYLRETGRSSKPKASTTPGWGKATVVN